MIFLSLRIMKPSIQLQQNLNNNIIPCKGFTINYTNYFTVCFYT